MIYILTYVRDLPGNSEIVMGEAIKVHLCRPKGDWLCLDSCNKEVT